MFVIQRYLLSITKILFLTIVTDLSNNKFQDAALNMGIVSKYCINETDDVYVIIFLATVHVL